MNCQRGSPELCTRVARMAGKEDICMKTTKRLLRSLLQEESGQDLIEYALIATLIALVAITGLNGLGSSIEAYYTKIGGDI